MPVDNLGSFTNDAYNTMGFVGWVRFRHPDIGNAWIRATDADLRVSQSIDKPDVVDGKIDRTVYQLNPKEVGGSVNFPAVYEQLTTGSDTPAKAMWKKAMKRNKNLGGDLDSIDVDIKYTNGTAFTYQKCAINSFEFSVTESDVVTVSLDVIGINRESLDTELQNWSNTKYPEYALRNSRIVTWNDAIVKITFDDDANLNVWSPQVRSFNVTVDNGVTRYYTLNGYLSPAVVLPTKREITGSLTLLGRDDNLSNRAFNNERYCTATGNTYFGYDAASLGSDSCGGNFFVKLPGCVFEIEELAITNDIFETTMNWHCLPGIAFNNPEGLEDWDTYLLVDSIPNTGIV
jgi:hypothetical protein